MFCRRMAADYGRMEYIAFSAPSSDTCRTFLTLQIRGVSPFPQQHLSSLVEYTASGTSPIGTNFGSDASRLLATFWIPRMAVPRFWSLRFLVTLMVTRRTIVYFWPREGFARKSGSASSCNLQPYCAYSTLPVPAGTKHPAILDHLGCRYQHLDNLNTWLRHQVRFANPHRSADAQFLIETLQLIWRTTITRLRSDTQHHHVQY